MTYLGNLINGEIVAAWDGNGEDIRQCELVAVQMNAHLCDAEVALYRYQINGETGFRSQFIEQLNNFSRDLEQYRQLAGGSRK